VNELRIGVIDLENPVKIPGKAPGELKLPYPSIKWVSREELKKKFPRGGEGKVGWLKIGEDDV